MTKRLDGLDAVKIIAAAVIILEHSVLRGTQGDYVAYFIYGACHIAVPTFFAISGYIAGLKPSSDKFMDVIKRQSKRLLIPAAFWTVFYVMLALWRTGSLPWRSSFWPWALVNLGGGGYAWFLVVLFLISLAAYALDKKTNKLWPSYVGIILFTLLGFIQPKGPVGLGLGTFNVFVLAYGAVYWMAFRIARGQWRPRLAASATTALSMMLLAGGFQMLRQSSGMQTWSWLMYVASSIAGFAILGIALDQRLSWNWALRPLGWARACTLGIYIVHPAYLYYIFRAMPPIQPLYRTFLTAAVTFFVTAVGVALLRRLKIGRALL